MSWHQKRLALKGRVAMVAQVAFMLFYWAAILCCICLGCTGNNLPFFLLGAIPAMYELGFINRPSATGDIRVTIENVERVDGIVTTTELWGSGGTQ